MEQDKFPDEIFKRGAYTTMEKLLFATSYIKDLKKRISEQEIKIGVLESEKSELIDAKKLIENNNKNLKAQNDKLNKANQELQNGFRKEKYIKELLEEKNNLNQKLSNAVKSNREIVAELCLLKNQPNKTQ
jgi:predicted RNase H-like nuclease (RuvC/YqgF family)